MSINRQVPDASDGGDPTPHLELPGPTVQDLGRLERIDRHHHDRHQLIHPGSGVLQVETAAGSWVVPPQRAVWIPAFTAHAHLARTPTRMRSLSFPAEIDPVGGEQPAVLVVTPLLHELVAALAEPPETGYSDAEQATLRQAATDQLARAERLTLHLPAPVDDRLRAVAALLHRDPADPRSLRELGAAVGASERTLSRLFRAETGLTFPQWRTRLRLHHAIDHLAAGRSVTATAAACGYATPSAFIEAFRTVFGTTPSRHRLPSAP
ncbi:AraC family transcriptional regulator [Streptacidiphilus anmyonensis]|uniref:AraC family transcriptional regulator n=1 Tax=Streptacidiphilus anmyonensis TaxID=405782 RepID=UPI000A060CD9|nr:helix-turn-helix transcriptional regulator [Streptacidiphilus anmyonensis]